MSNQFSAPIQPQSALKPGNDPQPMHSTPGADVETTRELIAERDRLQVELNALKAEHAKTVAALAEITEERNIYHREVMHLMRDDGITITKEDLEEVLKNGVSLHDTLREVEAMLGGTE